MCVSCRGHHRRRRLGPGTVASGVLSRRVKAVPRRRRGFDVRDLGFPRALADWISADGDLLQSLEALRRLGTESCEAVAAVRAIRRIVRLRLSWELWAALIEGEGGDPEGLLLRMLPLETVERARLALWGPSWRDEEGSPRRGGLG